MFQKLILIILVLVFNISIFAQTEQLTAPIKWERYKISEQKISILLPKLPVVTVNENECFEQKTRRIAVYADGVVYGFDVVSRLKSTDRSFCSTKLDFSEATFTNRLGTLKEEQKLGEESKFKQGKFEVIKLTDKVTSYWLINDYANKRWFEFWVKGADEKKKEVADFISSLTTENSSGIEIGNGAKQSLGDVEVKDFQTDKVGTIPLNIGFKIPAKYTNEARQNQIQGVVRLRVVFLTNGSIGTVSPVRSLPFGLTEQAIAAAKKIVFIPLSVNGKYIGVTKQIDYSFTLY